MSNPASQRAPGELQVGAAQSLRQPGTRILDPGLGLAALLALFTVVPLLQPGLPATADTPIHFYRALELSRSWAPGMLYPRWAPDFAYGYGLPFWNFTPPLPYVLALLVHASGLSLAVSLKTLLIATSFAYTLGAYLFVRDTFGPASGLVAAAVFGVSTFALRESLLYGGNIPQYMAVALFPWLMWAVGRAVTLPHWRNILLTALVYAAIVLCHQFHALVISPVALGYALVIWFSRRNQWRNLAAAAGGLGLGLAVSCFFWLPALLERQWTGATESAYLDVNPFYTHFLSLRELTAWPQPLDHSAANPWLPFTLQPVVLLLVLLGVVSLGRYRSDRRHLIIGLFWLSVFGVTLFLLLPPSQALWYNLPFLALAQFPWRLLGVTTLAMSALVGAGADLCKQRSNVKLANQMPAQQPQQQQRGIWLPAALAAILILLAAVVYLYPFLPFIHYGPTVADMTRYEVSTHNIGMTTLGEYVPKWASTVPTTSPFVDDLIAGRPVDPFDPASLPLAATADLVQRRPNSFSYHIDSPQSFSARFRTFYFPGWQAIVDDQVLPARPEPQTGFVTVSLPAGSHSVELIFADTPLRQTANASSIVSLLAIMIVSAGRGIVLVRRPTVHTPRSTPMWPLQPAALVAACLIALLACKSLYVDHHTNWFRRSSPSGQVLGVQHPLSVSFGGDFHLLGYDINRQTAAQGQRLEVVLYWQKTGAAEDLNATNYRTFVHLDSPVDRRTWAASDHAHPGDPVAQIDLPTATWDTGRYVRDRHIFSIPADVPPVSLNVTAGIYNPDTDRRLTVLGTGEDTFVLQSVQVQPGHGLRVKDIPTPMAYDLGTDIALLGYGWDTDSTTLTLFWRAQRLPASSSVVFVHLLDTDGSLVWGADSPPVGGLYPTTGWQPGYIIADPRVVELSALPAGAYTVAVGMYDPASGQRLAVRDSTGASIPADSIPLFHVRVD